MLAVQRNADRAAVLQLHIRHGHHRLTQRVPELCLAFHVGLPRHRRAVRQDQRILGHRAFIAAHQQFPLARGQFPVHALHRVSGLPCADVVRHGRILGRAFQRGLSVLALCKRQLGNQKRPGQHQQATGRRDFTAGFENTKAIRQHGFADRDGIIADMPGLARPGFPGAAQAAQCQEMRLLTRTADTDSPHLPHGQKQRVRHEKSISDLFPVQRFFRVSGHPDRQVFPRNKYADCAIQEHQRDHCGGKTKQLEPECEPEYHERGGADPQHQGCQGHMRLLTGTATAAVISSSRLSGLTAFMRASGVSWMRWLSTGRISWRTSSGST